MTKRTVVHVLKGVPNPDTLNGVNKVVHNLATEQWLRGDRVEVWAIGDDGASAAYERVYPLRVFELQRARFRLDACLPDAVAACRADTLFHLHSVFVPELYALSRLLKRRGLPWVIAPHGGYAPESRKKNALAKTLYMALFERRYIEQASAVHAIGEFGEADQFDPRRFADRLGLVPNGQGLPERFRSGIDAQGPLRIVYCGRLARAQKGLDLLLRALDLAVRRGLDVTLELIGEGADRTTLEALCQACGLQDRVRFHGARLKQDKQALLLRADLFVHTSRWDVIPTAVLEAASLGIPLLVSAPTNLGRYVTPAGAGYVLDALTPEAIAVQITQALADKRNGALAQKGAAARAMIRDSFGWAAIAEQLERAVYAKVPGVPAAGLASPTLLAERQAAL